MDTCNIEQDLNLQQLCCGNPISFCRINFPILCHICSLSKPFLLTAAFSFGSGFREFLSVAKRIPLLQKILKSFRSGTPCLEFVKDALIVIQQGNKEQFNFNYQNQLLIVDVCE
jgi:hypothetical protein